MWSAKVDADDELEVWANVRDKGEKERGVLYICLDYQIWDGKRAIDRYAVNFNGMPKFVSCSS
jgi:hypothetical protein